MEQEIVSTSTKKNIRISSDNYRSARLQVCFRALECLTATYKEFPRRFSKLDVLQAAKQHIVYLEQRLASLLAEQGNGESVETYQELFLSIWNSLYESQANTPKRGRPCKRSSSIKNALVEDNELLFSQEGSSFFGLANEHLDQRKKEAKCKKRLEGFYSEETREKTFAVQEFWTYDPYLSQTRNGEAVLLPELQDECEIFGWSPVKNLANL